MQLRQIWVALSQTRQTVMYSTVSPSLILPPSRQTAHGAVSLSLGAERECDARELWIAITRDDARSAA